MDYNTDQNGYYVDEQQSGTLAGQSAAQYMARVMGWMFTGLFTTFVSTLLCLSSSTVMGLIFSGPAAIYGIIAVQLALVLALSFALNKISPATATVLFLVYSATMGVTMSVVSMVFTLTSIITVFFTTSIIFLGLSAYGLITKRDLTKIGTLAVFGLIGVVIGGLINLFMRNSMLDLIITCAGVVVFTVLIAYDTQKIKNIYYGMANGGYSEESPEIRKLAIIGAFTLYLDFVNLFLKLSRLMGKRK